MRGLSVRSGPLVLNHREPSEDVPLLKRGWVSGSGEMGIVGESMELCHCESGVGEPVLLNRDWIAGSGETGTLGDLFPRRNPGSGETGMLGDLALLPRRRLFEGEIANQEDSVSLRAGLRLWLRAVLTDCGETGRITSDGLRVESVTLEENVGAGEGRGSRVLSSF